VADTKHDNYDVKNDIKVDELQTTSNPDLDKTSCTISEYRNTNEYKDCDVSCAPHLPNCLVSGLVVNNDQIQLTVTLKDICGSPVLNQTSSLEVQCNKQRNFAHIEEFPNGLYHIQYIPRCKENHSLSVYWRNLKVNSEEIKVLVNIREYRRIRLASKFIRHYGPNKDVLMYSCLLAKGPNNELITRDYLTHKIVVFDEHFEYSHVIGGMGSGNGTFQTITGIAVSKKENLYVADESLGCIQKFKLSGEFISQFGSAGTAEGHFISPYGLALSQSELLFVCDSGNNRIQVFQNELFSYCFGQHGTKPGTFSQPRDLALNNSEDQVFISEWSNHRIQVFTTKGQFLKVFASETLKLQHPVGIHYTPDNHVLISSNQTGLVLVFKEDGQFLSAIKGTSNGKKRFRNPCGVLMMDDGRIIVAGTNMLVEF